MQSKYHKSRALWLSDNLNKKATELVLSNDLIYASGLIKPYCLTIYTFQLLHFYSFHIY